MSPLIVAILVIASFAVGAATIRFIYVPRMRARMTRAANAAVRNEFHKAWKYGWDSASTDSVHIYDRYMEMFHRHKEE